MTISRRIVSLAFATGLVATLIPLSPAWADRGSAIGPSASAPAAVRANGLDDLHLVGDAIRKENGRILLVDRDTGYNNGAAYTADPVDVTSFTLASQFHVRGVCSDGLAVVIQGEGPGAIGGLGGSMGYAKDTGAHLAGITHSLAIELDTFRNGSWSATDDDRILLTDPKVPHLSLQTRGAKENEADPAYSLISRHLKPVQDGRPHRISVTYSGGMLTVSYGPKQIVNQAIDLDQTLALHGGPAYIGWTAANGGCQSNTVISRFDLT